MEKHCKQTGKEHRRKSTLGTQVRKKQKVTTRKKGIYKKTGKQTIKEAHNGTLP